MMNQSAYSIQRTYLTLLLFNTLAASFIWGINTLFLLDAGLNNAEAFAANAFFTAGMVLFEVPTGVIADLKGRRLSYLLGTLTLTVSTLLYFFMWHTSAPFWGWAVASVMLGLGFTFFSGAVEAWLVDALNASNFKGKLESVFAKGEIVEGTAMLGGSIAGGLIAQATNLGVPYIIRVTLLLLTFALAFWLMKDIGFKPAKHKRPLTEVKDLVSTSLRQISHRRPVRWVMLAGLFTMGVFMYGSYAMQPYLLELFGDEKAYGIAGLSAAIVAGVQIAGGFLVPYISRVFHRRTTVLVIVMILSVAATLAVGLIPNFWLAITMLALWGLMFSIMMPIRQSYLNRLIPSKQRATMLSFDSLLSPSGGVGAQPLLGRTADMWGYANSYLWSAGIQALSIPLLWLARREKSPADIIESEVVPPPSVPAAPDNVQAQR